MAAEPQRLIAVSLGKIAASRSQRGGINLHKNLLVASVLHKARTAYMMENFQQMLAAKRAQTEQTVSQSPVPEKTSANFHETACHEAHGNRSANSSSLRLSESSDKENTPPRESTPPSGENMDVQDNVPFKKTDSVLNSRDSVSVNQQEKRDYVSKPSDKGSCLLKRRRSNTSQDVETVLAKKAKYSDNDDSDSSCEPMQTEAPQISNLVSIFNTGFGGLCSTNSDNGDLQLGFTRSDSLTCSSQVMENRVELPTAIALAV